MDTIIKVFRYFTMGLITLKECEECLKDLNTTYEEAEKLFHSTRRV